MTEHELNLLDARLKRAEAHGNETGNTWLRNLARRQRRRAAEQATADSEPPLPRGYEEARAAGATRRTREVSQ